MTFIPEEFGRIIGCGPLGMSLLCSDAARRFRPISAFNNRPLATIYGTCLAAGAELSAKNQRHPIETTHTSAEVDSRETREEASTLRRRPRGDM